MDKFLVIQTNYLGIEIGLFEGETLIGLATVDKFNASQRIISLIHEILTNNSLFLDDLSFIAANQGPGPFTSLRVVISTVNGLSFATEKPLIGIDGLKAFAEEYPNTTILLNAYNKDVYYHLSGALGYKKIHELLEEKIETPHFIGNATAIYKDLILEKIPNAVIPDPIPLTCSINKIGSIAWIKWQDKKELSKQLLPLYLKTASPK